MADISKRNIVDIDLDKGNIVREFLNYSIGSGDKNADNFGMRIFRGDEPVDLTDVTCQGHFRDPAGNNIALTEHGTISGNIAFITLPQACYNYDGQFCMSIKLIGGGVTGTMRIIDGMVDNTHCGNAVAPTGTVPTYQEVLVAYDDAIAAVEDVNELKQVIENGGKTVNNSDFSWQQGNISTSTGAGSSSNNRVRTPAGEYINLSGAIETRAIFAIASGYKLGTREYNSEGTYTGNYNSFTETTLHCNLHPGCKYRLVLARTDDANITPSDIPADVITCTYAAYTDESLSQKYKAADAKVTGDSFRKANTRINDLITTVITGAAASFSSLEIGAYRDLSTGSKQTDVDDCATSGSLNISKRKAITFTDDDYLFSVLAFSGTPIGSDRFVRALTDGWLEAGEIVTVSKDTTVISVQVKKKDGTDIEDSEADTIKSAFMFYSFIDDTLSEQGVPADAKAVGEAVETAQTSFYKADDDVTLVTTADDVYDLFDALVTDHPDFVTKNTLTSGSFTNYEYVFTRGNYNSQNGRRAKDNEIAKPVILITSGVHGYERSSVMSLYTFCKALCENKYSLSEIINSAVFKVIPVVCPWGYTNDSRINANGVNINRNFASSSWELTPTGSDYSGAEPGDQDETKVVQNWIDANTNAAFVLDWHNSSYTNEISCLLGDTAESAMTFKKRYLFGMNNIIPYWMKLREIPSSNIYAYTGNTTTGGTLKSYAQEQNLLAFTFETSWNVISSGKHSAFSIGTGAEAFGNMMLGLEAYMELT